MTPRLPALATLALAAPRDGASLALARGARPRGRCCAAASARADSIPVKTAELRVEEGEVLLNAEFELSLNPTLEEALQRGIPLYFVLEVEIARPRWYWLDEKVLADVDDVARVATRRSRGSTASSSGLMAQTLDSLEEVERLIGRVTSRPIARARDLERGVRYDAVVRLRLDVEPAPEAVPGRRARVARLAARARMAPVPVHAVSHL